MFEHSIKNLYHTKIVYFTTHALVDKILKWSECVRWKVHCLRQLVVEGCPNIVVTDLVDIM